MTEERKLPLPSSCAACVYYPSHPAPGGLCRRHAPPAGHEEYELVHWPKVRPSDRCGAGAALSDGTGPGVVACHTCVHWHDPSGEGIRPDYRRGIAAEWWAETGYCTRLAPAPAAEEHRRTFWKVTHAEDGCGDGEVIEAAQALYAPAHNPVSA